LRTVQLDGLETQVLGVGGGVGEGADGVGDGLLAHALAELLARARQARRAVIAALGVPFGVAAAHRAHVPQLRRHHPAGLVHRIDHPLPGRQFGLAMEARDIGVVQRARPVDPGAFRHDQADLALGAALVVLRHVLRRHAARRERPGHGGHDDTVLEVQSLEGEGSEKGVGGHGRSGQTVVRIQIKHGRQATSAQKNCARPLK
jgi:hypothetical protein